MCPPVLARCADNIAFMVLLLADGVVKNLSPQQALAALGGVIARIHDLGGFVTVCLTGDCARGLRPLVHHLPRTVEVLCLKPGEESPLLAARAGCYDLIAAADLAALEPIARMTRRACALLHDGQLELLDAGEDRAGSGYNRRGRLHPV
jgi:hypothetical protein